MRFYRFIYCSPCDVRWWPGWVWLRMPGAGNRPV